MRYGIILTAGDIHQIGEMARQAEEAGWDGVFTWDGVMIPGFEPVYDPWVTMAVIAMRTERVRFGAVIMPLSRRRPWKVARESVTLDHLSHGRLVLPVGLGALDDLAFGGVGEATDRRERAERLDETLDILEWAWRGEPFSYEGKHYRMPEFAFRPPSVQQPRIPVWVVTAWGRPKSVERAFRYDGIMPFVSSPDNPYAPATPDVVREIARAAPRRGAGEQPYDIVLEGTTPAGDPVAARANVRPLADAGATWWLESPWDSPSVDALRARITAGPPR
jgi:alkanesulfonate monooxygenase SsuD/methylene tetrahydromethanopterin reductase-like flavin-dependent oxidoreductase (luciferase family)